MNEPQTLDEKIQWLKINEYHKDIYTTCADKYKVREYVTNKGLNKILNPLIGIYKDVEEIKWDELPNKFVLKWNFGNGFNFICHDKTKINKKEVCKKLKNWGKTKSHLIHAELQYRNIPKLIICEEFLEGKKEGSLPEDFKVYCFNGSPKYILVCEAREKGWPKFYFFTPDWELARINKDSIGAPDGFTLPKPKVLDDVLKYSKTLSNDFKFVRVDFYIVNDKVYFGELTFSPSGGFDINRLPETDLLFGNQLILK
ncbi:MAG: ATP-grasp fold amidoligase family protein [Psychroflexus halocasei]